MTLNQPTSMATWITLPGRFGSLLFSLAITGMGVEALVWSCVSGHGPAPHYRVVPVIPWPPAIPGLVYPIGVILILCGICLFIRRTTVVSSITLGGLMICCALAFDVPRRPDLMSPEWRTNVLEPIAIGCMAWLGRGRSGAPGWLRRTGRYLLALALIVFGIAHFQVLTFIADLVPGWIPWHRFWAIFTGLAFVAAGISFAVGWLERWAALSLGLMFALWLLTIHLPPVLTFLHSPEASPDPDKWSDVLIVAALWGGSWMVAGNLFGRRDSGSDTDPARASFKSPLLCRADGWPEVFIRSLRTVIAFSPSRHTMSWPRHPSKYVFSP